MARQKEAEFSVQGIEHAMRLLCVRHGETLWNLLKLVQGSSDIALTENGINQAKEFSENPLFSSMRFTAAYSSDLIRAHKTAEILCESKGSLPVQPTPELRERFLGDFEGKPLRDMISSLSSWEELPSEQQWTTSVGNGETFEAVHNRITSFISRLQEKHNTDDTLLLVTHSDVLRALYLRSTKEYPLSKLVGYHNLGYLVIEVDKVPGSYQVVETHGQVVIQ